MNFNNYVLAFVLALTSVFSPPTIAAENADIRFEFTGNTLSIYPNVKPLRTSAIPEDMDRTCLSNAEKQQTRTFICDSTKPKQEKFFLKFGWIPLSGEITRIQYQMTINSTGPTIIEQVKTEGFESGKIADMLLFRFCLPVLALLLTGYYSAKENKKRAHLIALYCTILIGVAMIFATETTIGPTASIPLVIIAILIGFASGGILGGMASIFTSFFVYDVSTTGKSDEFFMILAYLKFLSAACLASFALRELTEAFLDRDMWTKKLKALYLEYRRP